MQESRTARSERYWSNASEAFHNSFMAKNPEMREAFVRMALSWAALANELEQAELAAYVAGGNPPPPRPPVRPRAQ